MVPPRTTQVFAKQQAGTLVKDAKAGLLTRDDILLVRFVALVEHVQLAAGYAFGIWELRDHDLREAAELAGLKLGKYGWEFIDGEPAPFWEFDHLIVATDVMRRGSLLASAWILDGPPLPGDWRKRSRVELVDDLMWGASSAFTWAWWTCRMKDGDSPLTITSRALSRWNDRTQPLAR